jgi:N-acetylmuramic acid 6-phosphate etherase
VLGNITPGKQQPVSSMQNAVFSEPASLTEANNPATANIDALPTLEMLQRMNDEDARIAPAIADELPHIAQAVDAIAERLRTGGRLIYVGAGTSGRLGILDASEMPPTFSTQPEMVIAIIAGGDTAIRRAVEGAEDNVEQGRRDVMQLNVTAKDCLAGLSASGRTPYVIGAMKEARERGALVISIACNRPCAMEEVADISIAPLVGPEVISGSTRMKAGTAEKLVLNMLSTGAMIRLGKTFGNLMVDLQATNSKLRDRARRIVERACGIDATTAAKWLEQCNGEVKTAIVCQLANIPPDEARRRLIKSNGIVRAALEK